MMLARVGGVIYAWDSGDPRTSVVQPTPRLDPDQHDCHEEPRRGGNLPGRESDYVRSRTMDNGTRSARMSRQAVLRLMQQREPHVYALVTCDGAIKIGVTVDLATRHQKIAFGGTDRYLGFMPGDYAAEQAIHESLPADLRIGARREYYYPLFELVLPPINVMRESMGIPLLSRRDLPRPGHWTRRLPRPTREVSWQVPAPWAEGLLDVG